MRLRIAARRLRQLISALAATPLQSLRSVRVLFVRSWTTESSCVGARPELSLARYPTQRPRLHSPSATAPEKWEMHWFQEIWVPISTQRFFQAVDGTPR